LIKSVVVVVVVVLAVLVGKGVKEEDGAVRAARQHDTIRLFSSF